MYQIAGFFVVVAVLHVGFNFDKYNPFAAEAVPAASAAPQDGATPGARQLTNFPDEILLNGSEPTYEDSSNKYVLILHSIGVIYMFVGLAVVCDDYFVAALEEMCDTWSITEDVAGATFMAAGGSAPELFTSLLGVFVAESDVGFGTIVGSAVFNVLFVIGLCAIFAKQTLELTWWPLARDCSYYTFGLLVLVYCVYDNEITWYESAILLLCYVGYVTIMKFNMQMKAKVENCANACCGRKKSSITPSEREAVTSTANAVAASNDAAGESKDTPGPLPSFAKRLKPGSSLYAHHHALAAKNEVVRFRDYRSATLRAIVHGHLDRLNKRLIMAGGGTELERRKSWRYRTAWDDATKEIKEKNPDLLASHNDSEMGMNTQVVPVNEDGDAVTSLAPASKKPDTTPTHVVTTGDPNSAIDTTHLPSFKEEGEEEDDDSLWDVPETAGGKALWAFALPINFLLWATIPNCAKPKFKKWFLVTFIMSLVWIAAFSYFMVWWASVFGFALGIPAPVMGLTILAGGTSIPDALSSVIVARNGFGDMAVSSSIGSNIFDINVGLPLPWLLKTAAVNPGDVVPIQSCGMGILSISLLVMVLFVILSIKFSGWKLSMKLGGIMFILYLVFVTESLLLEYSVFGELSC